MAKHSAQIDWKRNEQAFLSNQYSRAHTWQFDGGLSMPASSSPHVVPLPWSDANAVDPEEAFVASLSSCHMLWFLSMAVEQGFEVDSYSDLAEGIMGKNDQGNIAITRVTLRPHTNFSGAKRPDESQLQALHHQAHAKCFIANSVTTEIRCEPSMS